MKTSRNVQLFIAVMKNLAEMNVAEEGTSDMDPSWKMIKKCKCFNE